MPGFTVDIVRGNPGTKTDRSQQRALGERVFDTFGRTWSYVRFGASGSFGQLMRDGTGTDLVGATRTVSAATPAGERVLTDAGIFTDTIGPRIVGALGVISTGTGLGQTFVITSRIKDNANQVRIKCLSGVTDNPTEVGPGWDEALATDSIYDLLGPGSAYVAAASSVSIRGFLQRDVASSDIDKYGYVLQKGFGFGLLDFDGTAIAASRNLVPGPGGTLVGAANASGNVVAKSLFADVGHDSDNLTAIDAMIENSLIAAYPVSYDHPIDQFLDIL